MIEIDKDGNIKLEDGAKTHPDIIALKESVKEDFDKFLIYLYHTYCKKSIFRNLEHAIRRVKVCITYLHDYKPEFFEDNKLFQKVVKEYNNLQYTTTEKELENLLFKDIPELRAHLMSISFYKKEKIQIDREVEIEVEYKKKTHTVTIPVSQKVEITIDNSSEKRKALDNAEVLFNMEKRLRLLIDQESVSQGSRRKFDTK